MRLFELSQKLFESSGGVGRRWLEVQQGKDIPFKDKQGQDWTIVDCQYFPANPRLKYDDTADQKGKEILLSEAKNYVEQTWPGAEYKVFGNIGKAGILVVLQHDSEIKAFLKVTTVKRDTGNNPIFWQTTEFAAMTGFVAQTAQMKKSQVPLDPADIISPGQLYTVDQLISHVDTSIQQTDISETLKSSVTLLLKQIQTGISKPLPGLAEFKPVIEIKLGEIAAPIALVSGNMCSGQYKEAEDTLLKPANTSWKGITQISFPPKAEKLVDSYLHYGEGKKLGISSKDSSGGAKPSTAIIADTLLSKAEEFDKNPDFNKRFKTIKDNILLLDQESAINGPIRLGVRFRFITKNDALWLQQIYGKGVIPDTTFKRNSPNLYQLIKSSPYKPDISHPEYQTGFHILAVIARLVVDHMNKDTKRITSFFKEVLNKSDIVQIYAKTTINGDALCYKSFDVVYPPTFGGQIKINADSFTSRTKPSRKIGFELKKQA